MELLIVGTLDGQIGAASKIAIAQGGHVSLADNEERGLEVLRSGKAVELVMIDVKLDVYKFITALENAVSYTHLLNKSKMLCPAPNVLPPAATASRLSSL